LTDNSNNPRDYDHILEHNKSFSSVGLGFEFRPSRGTHHRKCVIIWINRALKSKFTWVYTVQLTKCNCNQRDQRNLIKYDFTQHVTIDVDNSLGRHLVLVMCRGLEGGSACNKCVFVVIDAAPKNNPLVNIRVAGTPY